jgi:hypothetical protein
VAPKALFNGRGGLELAAVRAAAAPPAPALLEAVQLRSGIRGWPRRPDRRGTPERLPAAPRRAGLRVSLVCWPSERGWPMPLAARADARAAPDAGNTCEWWLLPWNAAGEPDLGGNSFALEEPAFAAGAAKWARAFDASTPLDDTLFLEEPPPPSPAPAAAAAGRARCGDAARERVATLDRFEQWDLGIRRASAPSLDRASFTLSSAAWFGHCRELDVLRAALESQLECAVAVDARCTGAETR